MYSPRETLKAEMLLNDAVGGAAWRGMGARECRTNLSPQINTALLPSQKTAPKNPYLRPRAGRDKYRCYGHGSTGRGGVLKNDCLGEKLLGRKYNEG
ncbi:hypothetical protein J6590_042676 [Homalodisca vitripennis]|nr:hypothetical protein J6590_042676 [Homalodisca vitripennis]